MNYHFIKQKTAEGKNNFIEYIKMLIYKTRKDLFDRLDFNAEAPFMEPMLYTWFNFPQQKISLDQLLYGYMALDRRPVTIQVLTESTGIIYLPNIGYYHTDVPGEYIDYHGAENPATARLLKDGQEIPYTFEKIYLLNNSTIELCLHNSSLIDALFDDKQDPGIEDSVMRHKQHLEKALGFIKAHYPEFDELLHATVKRIVIFKGGYMRSFASMLSNGTAFFNVHDWHDEVFFCEDITHQCGHVIYYAVMYNKSSFFSVPPETLIKQFNGRPNDVRTVLGAFYSLLPFCFSNTNSYRLYEAGVFSHRQLHEFLGRFAFRMRKFRLALEDFRSGEMLSEQGRQLWNEFEDTLLDVHEKVKPFLYQYDSSNQNYDFSYEQFLLLNPIDKPITTAL
jgi:hypothetical protein